MKANSFSRASATVQLLSRYRSRPLARRFTTLALDHPPVPGASSQNSLDLIRDRQLDDLKESLARSAAPTRVWNHYTSLLSLLGHEKLPLELHQEVLRRCTAPAPTLRASAARHLASNVQLASPHVHEGRFQTIIRNIRAMGVKPHLEDYHFILQHFAAVGHDTGAWHVYRELLHLGLQPRTRTYTLCLQTVAHRLSLPIPPAEESKYMSQTRTSISQFITDMQNNNIRLTSVHLDLLIRILKATSDFEGFQSLMKWGYGIDLSNPDCPPLEFYGVNASVPGLGDATPPPLRKPLHFSTAALNTTIDCLGQFGNVSKMIQAFEVLTQPLPQAAQHRFSSFDEDDEDFGTFNTSVPRQYEPPHAKPNTTTYNILLRHLSKAGHAVLLRHYLLEAIWLDKEANRKLHSALYNIPLPRVFAPHFSINRGTLMPVLGLSNRDKNLGLMRWLHSKIPGILIRKRGAIAYFTRKRDRLEAEGLLVRAPPPIPPKVVPPPQEHGNELPNARSPHPQPESSSFLSPSSLISRLGERLHVHSTHVDPPLQVDSDIKDPLDSPPPIKAFDIELHISILERDIEEIEDFSSKLEAVLGRTTQRVKERLGRRVWAGKDIYLPSEGEQRRTISREHWKDIVGYRPRSDLDTSIKSTQTSPSLGHPPSVPSSRRRFEATDTRLG